MTSDTPLLAPRVPQPQIQSLPEAPSLEIAPGNQKRLTTHAAKLLHFFLPNTSEASALTLRVLLKGMRDQFASKVYTVGGGDRSERR